MAETVTDGGEGIATEFNTQGAPSVTVGGATYPSQSFAAQYPSAVPAAAPSMTQPTLIGPPASQGPHPTAQLTSATTAQPGIPPPLPFGQPGNIDQILYSVAAELAQKYGVDPLRLYQIATATANQESGGDPTAVGDNGTSFGLFQLHQGGELGNLTQGQAFDPWTNAQTAMTVIAETLRAHPNWTDGQVAAGAQRPADPNGYAASIDAAIKTAKGGIVALGGGKGGGSFSSAMGGAGGQTPANLTIGQLGIAEAQKNYPELAWMLTIPDAAKDIMNFAAQHYTPDEIAAQLQGKPWYQRLGATFFTWIATQATNPTQAAQTFQEELASVRQTFAQLGLKPTDQQLQTFAYQALAQDWTNHPELQQQAIADTIAANPDGTFAVKNYTVGAGGQLLDTFVGPNGSMSFNPKDFQNTLPSSAVKDGFVQQYGVVGGNISGIMPGAPVYILQNGVLHQGFDIHKLAPGTPLYTLPNAVTATAGSAQTGAPSTMTGQLQTAEQAFKAAAADYMVPISDQAAAQLVLQAVQSGTTDIATFAKTYFQAQAKSLYPTMGAAIDAGITPKAYTDPYRQVVSQLLGVSPDQVNMMDPKYLRFVTQKDPKSGMPTAMSLYDAQQLVMSDPTYGYMKTTNAADRASALAQGLGELFGKTSAIPAGFSGTQAPRV